jgi:hypothetical protein
VADGERAGNTLVPLVTESGRAPQANERGRVCFDDLCTTLLSVYNPGDRCSVHAAGSWGARGGRSAAARALFDGF